MSDGMAIAYRLGGLWAPSTEAGGDRPSTGPAGGPPAVDSVGPYRPGEDGLHGGGPGTAAGVASLLPGTADLPWVSLLHQIGAQASLSGQATAGSTTLSGAASAEVHAGAGAETHQAPGEVSASAFVGLGASLATSGAIRGAWGSLSGQASVSAELLARACGYAAAGPRGLAAGASLEVSASLRAQGQADVDLFGGAVRGHASGSAEAGAGARARGDVSLSADPLEASVRASVGAFAGSRAGFSAQGGVPGATIGVHGEAWVGVGVQAEVAVGLHDGKFTFHFGVGVALGVGGFLSFDLEIDFHAIGKAIGDFFTQLFGGGAAAPALSGQAQKAIDDVLDRLAKPPARTAPDPPPEEAGPDVTPDDPALA